uniref:Transcriptional coactivator p15 n=1 Tax=Tetraselmis sp. GSL018 TaxID=582737 RepID=A0A061R104_9CHLO
MSSVTEELVKSELLQILKTCDFQVETERTIRKKLGQKLNCDVEAWKSTIKSFIHSYLENSANAEEDKEEANQHEEEDEDDCTQLEAELMAEMQGGKKRKASSTSAGPSKSAKRKGGEKVFPTGTLGKGKWNDEGEWVSNLSDSKRVCVREWKGSVYVDIREYYQRSGDWSPSKKGISLAVDQWILLKAGMDDVLHKIQRGVPNHVIRLAEERRLQLRSYKGLILVDIREFYHKGGELQPGKKGISLTGDLFATLSKRKQDVDAAVEMLGGDASRDVAEPADGASAAAKGALPVDDSEFSVALGPDNVRASITSFNGKKLVSIRHWVEKDGKLSPGFKGISLTAEQFDALVSGAERAAQALAKSDTGFSVELSPKRKVSVSVYSGEARLDIREYYGSEGNLKPTKKGISLLRGQWDALLQAAARLKTEGGMT